MSILQELEKSLHSDAPYYIEFLYRYDPKKKQAFAFYEGDEDASYYHFILTRSLESDYELEEIVAGCKNNVLKLQREFDWTNYNKRQILFFVDRDLSFWLDDETEFDDNIFITDEYSVENYIVNPSGFKAWLTRFEGFSRASKPEIDNMIKEFLALKSQFVEAIKPVMAEAVIAKRRDKSVSLSDYKLSKTLSFSIQADHPYFQLIEDKTIEEKWKITSISPSEIAKQIESFETNTPQYSIRGKWLLFFMAELGEFMRLHPNFFAPSLRKEQKICPTCAVASSQVMTALAPYCIRNISPSLRSFLDRTYRTYCKACAQPQSGTVKVG